MLVTSKYIFEKKLASLVIREAQIKTTRKDHFLHVGMTITKKASDTKC